MITIKSLDNFSKYYQHAIWTQIQGEQQPILSPLSNQFALHEARVYEEDTNRKFANWLNGELYSASGSAYREIIALTTAHLADIDVTIYAPTGTTHAQVLADALSIFASACTTKPKVAISTANNNMPILEPTAGYLEDDDRFADHYHTDPIEDLYRPIPEPKLNADDYDINLFQIVWVQGKTASMLGYALDDHSAIVPAFGAVPLKPNNFRFARHAFGKMAHVQQALAQAYNEHYNVDDCDWDICAELIESAYDAELGSRYETDTDPNNEANFEPEQYVDYIALAASDDYTGGTVTPRPYGQLVPREQMAHVQPAYTKRGDQPIKIRTAKDQQLSKYRRTPVAEFLAAA